MAGEERNQWVERVLGYRFAAGSEQRPKGAAVRVAQGLLVWNAARAYVGQQVKKLQQAIIAQTEDEADAAEIKANIGNLEALLELLDDSLSVKLGQLRATTDPTEKEAISQEAKAVVEKFRGTLAGNALFNEIDDNGFIPLDIAPKVTAALAAVSEAI